MARKSLYENDPEYYNLLMYGKIREGATLKQVAAQIGISQENLSKWLNQYPDFKKSYIEAKRPVDAKVEAMLLKRCVGYEVEETEIYTDERGQEKTKKIIRHIPPDVGAQQFWLKNRQKERWNDEFRIEQNANVSLTINVDYGDGSDDEHCSKQG